MDQWRCRPGRHLRRLGRVSTDKAVAAGKSLWIKVYSGEFEDWLKNCERLVKKYGSDRIFFFLPEMSLEQAEKLIAYADANWSDVKGTFEEEVEKNRK